MIWALLTGMVIHAQAASSPPAEPRPANRYLLVVESSRAMQRRSEGVASAVQRLLGSALSGQIHPGDSLGVWTFNKQLATGQVPLQEWPRQGAPKLAGAIAGFVRDLKYEKDADFAVLKPELRAIAAESEFITVILFSSGQNHISGTPFDAEVNLYFDTWKTEQAGKRMPFVTLLRAAAGKITHYSVTAFPWELELPPLPAALTNPPPKIKPVPVVVAPEKPRITNMLAPLIVSGKKPDPEPAMVAANIPSVVPAPTSAVSSNPPTAPGPVPVAAPTTAIDTIPAPEPAASVSEPPVAPGPSEPSPEVPVRSRRPAWIIGALVGVAILALIVGAWLVMRSRSRPRESLITSSLDREQEP
jgi:hypothetical protein